MKRSIIPFSILFLMFGLAACSDSDGVPEANKVISFAMGGAENSRALVTSGTNLRKVGLFGYAHSGSFEDVAANATPNWFLNWPLIKPTDTDVWTYPGPVKYWPQGDRNLSFFAYAPYDDLQEKFTLYPTTNKNVGAPTITYTVPANIYDQVDFLWDSQVDLIEGNGSNGEVSFNMKHALAKVDLKIKFNTPPMKTAEILSLTVKSMNRGTFDLLTGEWSKTEKVSEYDILIPNGEGLVLDSSATGSPVYMLEGGQYLMLIPQSMDNIVFELSYILDSGSEKKTLDLLYDVKDELKMGNAYTINLVDMGKDITINS